LITRFLAVIEAKAPDNQWLVAYKHTSNIHQPKEKETDA